MQCVQLYEMRTITKIGLKCVELYTMHILYEMLPNHQDWIKMPFPDLKSILPTENHAGLKEVVPNRTFDSISILIAPDGQKVYLLHPHVLLTSTVFSQFPVQQDKVLVAILAPSELAVQVQRHELAVMKPLPINKTIQE